MFKVGYGENGSSYEGALQVQIKCPSVIWPSIANVGRKHVHGSNHEGIVSCGVRSLSLPMLMSVSWVD